MAPQVATPVNEPPRAGEREWEIEFDGYRMLARLDGDQVRLFARNGRDRTAKLPHLQRAIQALRLGTAWLDGEIVILTDLGRTDFQASQNAFEQRGRT